MLTLQEKFEKVKDFRPIDDVFFEVLAQNKEVCQEILRVILEDDGLHEIFVNTVIDDGTEISELMACFMKKEVKNPRFPRLSAEVTRLKETEEGVEAVSEVMRKYEAIAVSKALQQEKITKIQNMLQEGISKEVILKVGYSEEEYAEAKKQMPHK